MQIVVSHEVRRAKCRMCVETRGSSPVAQRGAVGASKSANIASAECYAVVVAETVVGSNAETENVAAAFIDKKVVVNMQILPVFLHKNAAAVACASAFHGVIDKINIFTVAVVQIYAVAAVCIADKVDDVISDDDWLISCSHRRTSLENRGVVGVSGHVHHIVLDDTVVTDAKQIHRMIVCQDIVSVVCDGVAAHYRIVGERDVYALERLVQESAVFNQHSVVECVNVFTLVIKGDVTVFKMASNKLVVMANPFATGVINEVFVTIEIVV